MKLGGLHLLGQHLFLVESLLLDYRKKQDSCHSTPKQKIILKCICIKEMFDYCVAHVQFLLWVDISRGTTSNLLIFYLSQNSKTVSTLCLIRFKLHLIFLCFLLFIWHSFESFFVWSATSSSLLLRQNPPDNKPKYWFTTRFRIINLKQTLYFHSLCSGLVALCWIFFYFFWQWMLYNNLEQWGH